MPAQCVVTFTAICPECQADTHWQAEVSSNGDLSRSTTTYRIPCPCNAPKLVPKPLAAALDLSRAAWLRRSA